MVVNQVITLMRQNQMKHDPHRDKVSCPFARSNSRTEQRVFTAHSTAYFTRLTPKITESRNSQSKHQVSTLLNGDQERVRNRGENSFIECCRNSRLRDEAKVGVGQISDKFQYPILTSSATLIRFDWGWFQFSAFRAPQFRRHDRP